MKNSYRVQATAMHPEYELEQKLRDGMECSGFLLVTFDEIGKPKVECMAGVSIENLAYYIAHGRQEGGPVSNSLLQAGVIANGIMQAWEMKAEYEHERKMNAIRKHIELMTDSDLFREEDEDETADSDD